MIEAQLFLSNKYKVWRVIQGGDVLSEWQTEEVAKAYCDGFNAALKELSQ